LFKIALPTERHRRDAPLSKYSIEARIRSCSLSKDTVERLEKYIFEKAASINQLAVDAVREDYQIESMDSVGTETLRSIHEHGRHQFHSDTRRLVISYRRYHDKLTTLKLNFGRQASESSVELTVDGPNARETALGVLHELQLMIRAQANLNFIFHGRSLVVAAALFGASIAAMPLLFDTTVAEPLRRMNEWIALGVLAFWVLFVLTARINPYVIFESPESERTQRLFGWLLKGLLGVVAFAGIARLWLL
jgi:hypothetical protein